MSQSVRTTIAYRGARLDVDQFPFVQSSVGLSGTLGRLRTAGSQIPRTRFILMFVA